MSAMSLSERDLVAMREIVHASTCDDVTRVDGIGMPLPVMRALQRLVPCDRLDVYGLDWKVLGHYLGDSLHDGEAEPKREGCSPPEPYDGAGPSHSFWGSFWEGACSRPERTGDYASVTRLSDFVSDRQLWASMSRDDGGCGCAFHETMVVWPDGPGRTLRVIFWRAPGRDFDERERFILELLRPHLMTAYAAPAVDCDSVARLTPHQRAILRFVADGYTNAQIARRMNLAEGTIRTHLNRLYQRLEVPSRTAAATAYLADAELRRPG